MFESNQLSGSFIRGMDRGEARESTLGNANFDRKVEKLEQMFEEIDQDANGMLTRDELREFIQLQTQKTQGVVSSKDQIKHAMFQKAMEFRNKEVAYIPHQDVIYIYIYIYIYMG